MPNPLSTVGITGIDGITPVYNPNDRWCYWNIEEIYTGNIGANRYVPKIGDYVEDTTAFITYFVSDIDPVTLISSLQPVNRDVNNGMVTSEDVLIASTDDSYRVYLDTSVTPHVLAVDARLKVNGTMAHYAKLFRGANVTSTGKVVSFLYDAGGTFLTQNIPLELVSIDSHTNYAVKAISVCYTNEQLVDGELVTAVIYSPDGHVVSRRQLYVENTSFIRSVNSSQKYISHISLKSPFLSLSDANTLNYPINVPLQSFNMIGVVHYSDNSTLEMPVDGGKFKIMGLERFIATVEGQELQLGLSYQLSPGEISYGAVSGDGKFVTAPYRLVTVNQIGAYSVKLFAYPVWNDALTGYSLRWFMYNLDRDTSFEVTAFVRFNDNTPSFNGLAYGQEQDLSVRLNLRDVSPLFSSYIHVQTIKIALREPGVNRTTNWTIGFEPGQVNPYGLDVKARVELLGASLSRVTLNSGATTQADWLTRLYYNTKPLIDKRRETTPPVPNFFAIVTDSSRYEFPVAAWNNPLSVGTAFEFSDTMFIEFFRRTAAGDILLSKAGLPIYEI